ARRCKSRIRLTERRRKFARRRNSPTLVPLTDCPFPDRAQLSRARRWPSHPHVSHPLRSVLFFTTHKTLITWEARPFSHIQNANMTIPPMSQLMVRRDRPSVLAAGGRATICTIGAAYRGFPPRIAGIEESRLCVHIYLTMHQGR